jgi:DNA-binding MarR family transcriptional regulator
MDDINMTLMQQFNKAMMLLHRYQHLRGRERGPFTNPHRGQGRIFAVLKMKPEISQKDLAYLLDIRNQSLSELLSKMEKAGYITRNQSETDRRVVDIKLTDAGREAAGQAEQQKEDDNDLFSILSEEERQNLSGYFARIIAELEKKTSGEPDLLELFGSKFGMTPEMIEMMRSRQFTPEILEHMRSRGFPPEILREFQRRGGSED